MVCKRDEEDSHEEVWQGMVKRLEGILEKDPEFRPSVFFDVDLTLIGPAGEVIWPTVQLIHRLREHFGRKIVIVVWTGGESHARTAVCKCGLVNVVDIVVSKPAYCVDDCGELHLTGFTRFIDPISVCQNRRQQ